MSRGHVAITFFCLLWVSFGASAPALAQAPARKPPEFRGLTFGAPLSFMPDMEPVAAYGDTAFYRRSDEKPVLGESCATDVRYGFSRGALFFVRMTLTGCSGLDKLIAAYETKYGRPGREGAPGVVRLVWHQPLLSLFLSHFAREGKT